MNQPHKIRIRGPWNYETGDGETGVATLPTEWQRRDTTLQLKRKFNWVADLDDTETVWLVFEEHGGAGLVQVNGEALGVLNGAPAEFDVTRLLKPANVIGVELAFRNLDPQIPAGLWGEVRLEVRS